MTGVPSSFAEQQFAQLNTENFSNLLDAFERACAEFAEKPAFHCLGQSLTFADIDRLSAQFGE